MSDSVSFDLQRQLIALIRAFGLHQPEQTPCGQPVTVAEAHALMELSAEKGLSPNGLTQNELALRLGLEKSTVSRLVKVLEKRGWLERLQSDVDRRVKQLNLTASGHKVAQQLASARRLKFDRVLSAIPEDQRSTVIHSIQLLVKAIHASNTSNNAQ